MDDDDKPDDLTGGAPKKIPAVVGDFDIVFAIDGANGSLHFVMHKSVEFDFLAIELGAAPPSLLFFGDCRKSDGICFDTGDQVMVLAKKAYDNLLSGIIGIGDEIDGFFEREDADEVQHFV